MRKLDGMSPRRLLGALWRRAAPGRLSDRKYAGEAQWWRDELPRLGRWYDGETDWCGIPPPADDEKLRRSPVPLANAVATVHAMVPHYPVVLCIHEDQFADKRVLEVGCGPLAPIVQFRGCARHGLDPLVDAYLRSGWPLYDYPVTFVNAPAEEMPYADGYFDVAISVNALDHVDDFARAAREIQRVLRPGGELYLELDYHPPRPLEPQSLDDDTVRASFDQARMRKVCERTSREKYDLIAGRFGLRAEPGEDEEADGVLAVWHGIRT